MKIMKLGLAATTALTLSMTAGAVWANTADVKQTGDTNSAKVDQASSEANQAYVRQTGNNNDMDVSQGYQDTPGKNANSNRFGDNVGDPAVQQGDNNNAVIKQGGFGNSLGWSDDGFDQLGDNNNVTATQTGKQNNVNVIQQDSTAATDGTANTLTIEQGFGDAGNTTNNRIRRIEQIRTGGGGANTITAKQIGDTQNRIGEGNNNNPRLGLAQTGDGNTMTVTQDGYANKIELVEQVGNGNSATLTQDGDYNHDVNESATFSGAMAALVEGSTALNRGQASQQGNNNQLSYNVIGYYNSFAFRQEGDGNIINSASGVGNSNEVAVFQDGGHTATANYDGDGNDIGIRQDGGSGSTATVTISEVGGANGNRAGVIQNGNNHVATVSLSGDNNNTRSFDPLGAAGGLALSASLTVGLFEQRNGDNNKLTANVTGNDNLMAMVQDGNSNTATLTMTGSTNEGAIAQVGNSNVASLTQSGSGNNGMVSQ